MKNLTLTSVLLLILFSGVAQQKNYKPYYNEGEPWVFEKYNYNAIETIQDSLIKLNKVETKKTFALDKKGNKVLESITSFDEDNSYSLNNLTKRKVYFKSKLTSNNHKVYHWKAWGKNNSQYNTYTTIKGAKYLESKIVIWKNKILSRQVYFWSESGMVDSSHFYYKKSTQPTTITHYIYKDDKLIETKSYKKGELKQVKKYDCEPLGEVEKKVKTSKSCKNIEFDEDGNKIIVVEFTDNNGKTRKHKTTFVGDSEKLFRTESYDKKNRRTHLYETTDTSDINVGYTNKGKEKWRSEKIFKNGKLIEQSYSRKGKSISKTTYSYNKEQVLTMQQSAYNGKVHSTQSYEYNSIGLLTKQTTTNKRKIFTSFYEYD